MKVPDAISSLCHQFYPYYEYIQFTIFNRTTSQSLDEGTLVKSLHADNKAFLAAQGYNKGYHQWKIKCAKLEGYNAGIGISMLPKHASLNFVTQKNSWLSDPKFSHSYYWWSSRYRSLIYKYENGVRPEVQKVDQCYLTGDIVIVSLDCNHWKLSFKLISMSDGPEIVICQEFDVKPAESDRLYFPSISSSCRGDEFKVMIS